jgi:hypothetical protein
MVNRKWTRLGIVLFAGVVGCAVDSEPPVPEQTTEIRDANGTPISLDPERKEALERTHNGVTQMFLNKPQFGISRIFVPESYAEQDIVRSPATQSPDIGVGGRTRSIRAQGEPPHASFQKRAAELARPSQTDAVLPGEAWQFRTVQLVGLVVHPEPVVYESDHVPMAKVVGEILTRPLDAFEVRGLKKLREGENVYAETIPGKVARVMGPIYAGASCVSCHAKTGELLGAFSYTYDIGKIAPKPAKTSLELSFPNDE